MTALGPVPTDPLDRLDRQRRASAIGARTGRSVRRIAFSPSHHDPRRVGVPCALRVRDLPAVVTLRGDGRPGVESQQRF